MKKLETMKAVACMVVGIDPLKTRRYFFGIDEDRDLEQMKKTSDLWVLSHKYKGIIKLSRFLIIGSILAATYIMVS